MITTGFDLSKYDSKREFLVSKLNKVSEVALCLGIEKTANHLNKSISELMDEKFKIVVVGEFSRGKSTFINALLGSSIFPSFTRPTTTILNKISYSETPIYRIVLRDKNSTCKIITKEEFKNLVAPKEPILDNESSEREYEKALKELSAISFADIGYPTELCKGGVEIVDTPGTNDLDPAREEITYKFIPESDVAIMLLSANQILADSEMNFLKDRIIKADIQKIYFVINFKDRLRDEDEQLRVINYAREHLEKVVDKPKIFLVSSKGALNYRKNLNNEDVKGIIPTNFESTGFVELEKNLSDFLTNERGRIKLLKFIERGMRISRDLRKNSIAISLGTLNIGLNELEQRINKLRPEVERVRTICTDVISGLKAMLMNPLIETQDELRKGLEKIAYNAVKTVDNYIGPLSSEDIARDIEHVIAPMQTELQCRIRKAQQDLISDEVERVNRRLEYEWEAINNSIIYELTAQSSDKAYGLENLQDKDGNDSSYIYTGSKEIDASVLSSVLKLSVFSSTISRICIKVFSYFNSKNRTKVLGQVRVQVDNRYRGFIPEFIKSFDQQWTKNINKVISDLKLELDRKYIGLEQQLNSILNERSKEQAKVHEKRTALLKQDKLLEDLINDLKKLVTNLS